MKGFTFSLETVLRLRTQHKEQMLQRYAAANRELQQSLLEQLRLGEQIKSWQARCREQLHLSGAGELFRLQQATDVLQRQWLEKDRLRIQLENRVRQALAVYQEARKREEIIEKLKDRARKNWLIEMERKEQRLNDERATLMSARLTRDIGNQDEDLEVFKS
jgi:flagellar export protein FliJ